jgi:hypothetical protein
MATQLTPQDLQFLSMMPQPNQIIGGINALNQASFGNPVPANLPFGIVPTAPLPGFGSPAPAAPAPAAPAPRPVQRPSQQQLTPQQIQAAQQQNLNRIRQMLGLGPTTSGPSAALTPLQRMMQQTGGVRGATQGGPGVGSTAAKEALSNFERENVAVKPSLGSALQMGVAVSGPTGLALALGKEALTEALAPSGILGASLSSGFNVPGPQLSQAAMDEVTKAFYGALNPLATNIDQALAKASATLGVERALAGPGGFGTTNLSGAGPIGGWGVSPSGEITGNFTSGLGGRLIGAANFGGRGSTGGPGVSGGGADTGGGLGGGPGNMGGGSNRSM